MFSSAVVELREAIARLEICVDADDLAEVFRLRELLLAKAMAQLRDFDAAQLYQLSKASSTKQFLERTAGLVPADAGAAVGLARKLGALPRTEARWLAEALVSGQVRAIAANVSRRIADRYAAVEDDVLDLIATLTPSAAAEAMASWALHAHALVDDDESKPPREDELYHSKTLANRYVSKGSFGPLIGATMAKALELAEADTTHKGDTRSPAQRLAEALGDVCSFYVDYRERTDTDPDAPIAPAKRNVPHLVAAVTTLELSTRRGAALMDGTRIDHQSVEALSCTAQLLRLVLDEHGAIRSYELMPRSVTDALFGVIAVRDQHCRWPGCRRKAIHSDVHHVIQQQNGGATSPCNCILLCKYHHHRGAHDPHLTLQMDPDGTLTITYADGSTETTKPPILQPLLPHAR